MYCPVVEAFDNSHNTQLNEYERNNNKNYNQSYNQSYNQNIIPPDSFDNYNDVDVQQQYVNGLNDYKQAYPAFFTAQGDYTKNGTTINELKENEENDNDNLSFLDSNFSHESSISLKPKKKLSHQYCINKVLSSLSDESDNISNYSSQNADAYDHVKKCKYCKNKINEIMKMNSGSNSTKEIELEKKDNHINEYFTTQTLGYDFKELMIIILAGIILIFILDLLVKIGKKMNK